jgi:anti-sigma28 factor (negative regulator of flagellin synthesis)
MGTFIDGIAASENIDSSGEVLSMAGMDISMLVGSVFNWEHKSDTPDQVVGKILQAKKIYSDKDCENDRQLYFWNKCQTPFLYAMGELFDDYSDSAKHVAGLFRYDLENRGKTPMDTIGFSIEGAKIAKEGQVVTKSIARKITCTVIPCNKAAVAEIVPAQQPKQKDDLSDLFKTEPVIIELFKTASDGGASPAGATGLALAEEKPSMSGKKPNLSIAKPNSNGTKLNTTSSGVDIFSHGKVGEYSGLDAKGHAEAAGFHAKASENAPDFKTKNFHNQKAQLHTQASTSLQNKVNDRATMSARNTRAQASTPQAPNLGTSQKLHHPGLSGKMKPPGPVNKAEEDKLSGKQKQFYGQKNQMHNQIESREHEKQEIRRESGDSTKVPNTGSIGRTRGFNGAKHVTNPMASQERKPPIKKVEDMNKTLTAGSGLAAPDRLVGGAAIGKESLKKDAANPKLAPKDAKVKELQQKIDSGKYKPDSHKIADKILNHPEQPLKKSKWLARAEEEYQKWEKREQFETFIKSRIPHLTKGEIKVIGQTMLLNKAMRLERAMKKMAPGEFSNTLIAKKKK